MIRGFRAVTAALPLLLGFPVCATADKITFTGGTMNSPYEYVESGVRVEFVGGPGTIGDYYSAGNDVAHAHWETGPYGTVSQVRIARVDGSAFNFDYFVLTSNSEVGGGPASGNEQVRLHASADGTTSSYSLLLPTEDWGLPGTGLYLGSEFTGVKAVWFAAENRVGCFGMDDVYVNELPEPGTWALLLTGLAGMVIRSRRAKA